MPDTLLTLSGNGIAPYSARGCTQTLQPIEQIAARGASSSFIARTVNGGLVSVTPSGFLKYKSSVKCKDRNSPAIDGVWPGALVTVGCITELSYPTGGAAQRPAVAGSSRTDSGYTFYRPLLAMMVMAFQVETDEWGAEIGWQLDLEEV